MADCNLEGDKCLLHIIVIGFHHKKGCQVSIACISLCLFFHSVSDHF